VGDSEGVDKARPEAPSDESDRLRFHLRAGIALLILALASVVVVGTVIATRPHVGLDVTPMALPPGQFKGLATLETPKGVVTTSSRFVFEAEGASGAGAGSEYWYARPATSTVYQVNGAQVDVSAFGQRISKRQPMQVDVDASTPGRLDRINAVFPRGTSQ
jgi:hypothetical protein